MPDIKAILAEQFNVVAPCKKYGVSLWQCPSFLFVVMGAVIMISILASYFLGSYFTNNSEIAVLITIIITIVLFIIDYSIIQGFEKLAQASRMKSEFVNIVSHQLRTPLSSLSWTVELFISGQLGTLDHKQLEYFLNMKNTNTRMVELVNDLLDVSKIESGQFPLTPQRFSLADLIKDIAKNFVPFAEAHHVRLESNAGENIFTNADSLKVRQVIENLIDNAIRYIKADGDGKVNILLKQESGAALVEIQDNGTGIPKDDQPYIFQKFFRSRNIMRKQTEGSGLGLFIARAIIEKSGGKIGFKSGESGTTFWFKLPLSS